MLLYDYSIRIIKNIYQKDNFIISLHKKENPILTGFSFIIFFSHYATAVPPELPPVVPSVPTLLANCCTISNTPDAANNNTAPNT